MTNPFIIFAVLFLGLAIGWGIREYQFRNYPVVFWHNGEKVLKVTNDEELEVIDYRKPHLVREGEEKK